MSDTTGAPKLPFHQSTLFWGCAGAVITIVLTVVAAMTKDLRWLLVFAWPFASVAIWEFARTWAPPNTVKSIASFGVVASGLVLAVFYWLLVPPVPMPDPATTSTSDRPQIMLSLLGGNIFNPKAPDLRFLTGIALDVRIWNNGRPSPITEWRLTVIPPGRSPAIAQLTEISDLLRLGGAKNSAVLRTADDLSRKLAHEDVGTKPTDGTVLFYVKLDKPLVMLDETQIELSVKDLFGKETVVKQRMGDWLSR